MPGETFDEAREKAVTFIVTQSQYIDTLPNSIVKSDIEGFKPIRFYMSRFTRV